MPQDRVLFRSGRFVDRYSHAFAKWSRPKAKRFAGSVGSVPDLADAVGGLPRGVCSFGRFRCRPLPDMHRDAFRCALSGRDGRGSTGSYRGRSAHLT